MLFFLLYASIFYMSESNLRMILAIVLGIFFTASIIYYIILSYKYSKLKEYFWTNLNNYDKEVVNYGFHRSAHAKEGGGLLPFSKYWEKEKLFQEKRNETILKFDKEKGQSLIAIEAKLSDFEYILFFLFFILSISIANIKK